MLQEREIIHLLLEDRLLSSKDVSKRLATLGYLNSNGRPFSQAQVNSLLHSARQEQRRRDYRYKESCGIDRSKNPCGDASDY